jgi:photosystem II stability/assembly factor-like uncharacterized protein
MILRSLIVALVALGFTGSFATPQAQEAATADYGLTPYEHAMKSNRASQALLLDVAALSGKLVAVGAHGHIISSVDGGQNWTQANDVPTRNTLTSINFLDDKHGVAVGHDMTILLTEDGGDNWTLVYNDRLAELPLLAVIYVSADHILAFGAFSSVLESRDGGKSWDERLLSEESEDDYHLNDAFRGVSGAIYVPAEFGNVYRSTDNGETFEPLQTPYEGSFWGGTVLADDSIIVWGMRGNAFVSRDRGESWTKVKTNSDRSISGGTQIEDGRVVLTGLSGLVLVSTDGAKSFTEFVREDRQSFAQVSTGPDAGTVMLYGEPGVRPFALK